MEGSKATPQYRRVFVQMERSYIYIELEYQMPSEVNHEICIFELEEMQLTGMLIVKVEVFRGDGE